MPIAAVPGQHALATSIAAGTNLAVAFPSGTIAGSLIVVASVCAAAQTSLAPTDDKGNTYVAGAPEIANGGTPNSRISQWHAINTTAGTITVTANYSASNSVRGVAIAEFSGALISPYDTSASLATAATASAFSPYVSPVADGELIWGAGVNDQDIPQTDSGFILLDATGTGGLAHAYLIQTPSAPIRTHFFTGFSGGWAVLVATFKGVPLRSPVSPSWQQRMP